MFWFTNWVFSLVISAWSFIDDVNALPGWFFVALALNSIISAVEWIFNIPVTILRRAWRICRMVIDPIVLTTSVMLATDTKVATLIIMSCVHFCSDVAATVVSVGQAAAFTLLYPINHTLQMWIHLMSDVWSTVEMISLSVVYVAASCTKFACLIMMNLMHLFGYVTLKSQRPSTSSQPVTSSPEIDVKA